jgi:hypothetical protein
MRLSAGSCRNGSVRYCDIPYVRVSYQLQGPDGFVGDVCVQLNSGHVWFESQ